LATGWIVLIILGSLLLFGGIVFAIYAFWKSRRGFMSNGGSGNGGLKETYIQIS